MTWNGETVQASIENLRAGGRSDATIMRILGLTPEQGKEVGLNAAAPADPLPAIERPTPRPSAPAELGALPRLEWLPIGAMFVNARYQRTVRPRGEKAIEKMAKTFTWSKFQALTVAEVESGRFAIVDGQFRWRAATRRGDIPALPCLIVGAPALADQAASFVGINVDRTAVTALEVFWAGVAAGDEAALRVVETCNTADVEIARVATSVLPARTTIATNVIAKLMKHGATVSEALSLLAMAQPAKPNIFKASAITAVVTLLVTHGTRVDRERLLKTLEEMNFEEETKAAKAYRKVAGGTVDAALMTLITRAYNRRPGPGRLKEDATPAQEAA